MYAPPSHRYGNGGAAKLLTNRRGTVRASQSVGGSRLWQPIARMGIACSEPEPCEVWQNVVLFCLFHEPCFDQSAEADQAHHEVVHDHRDVARSLLGHFAQHTADGVFQAGGGPNWLVKSHRRGATMHCLHAGQGCQ